MSAIFGTQVTMKNVVIVTNDLLKIESIFEI